MKRMIFIGILITALVAPLVAGEGNIDLLDDSNFYEITGDDIYIVDFYADWCGPCVAFAPTFEAVANNLTQYRFAKVDVDESFELNTDFSIRYIPYVVAVKNGVVLEQYEGNRTAQDFSRWVEKVNSQY